MTTGDKIAKLRRENNYTQEQLADIFGVSRQSISKWESGTAYPEVDKLIRMGELFGCTMDYLLKDEVTEPSAVHPPHSAQPDDANDIIYSHAGRIRARTSERRVCGMPLWQVGKNARAVFAVGVNARGIVAVGVKSCGLVSVGVLSAGLICLGTLSFGLISIGLVAVGLLCGGCVAIGVLAAGSIALGVVSVGAIVCGDFAAGALAAGKYFAMGDRASAMIAIGQHEATGSLFRHLGPLGEAERAEVKQLLDATVPAYLAWAKELIKLSF